MNFPLFREPKVAFVIMQFEKSDIKKVALLAQSTTKFRTCLSPFKPMAYRITWLSDIPNHGNIRLVTLAYLSQWLSYYPITLDIPPSFKAEI
ncbi:Uncharacterised protein [Yersinia enterocolitica]|nr:hypothetical protein DJ61_2869 [Yersinia enterocolitica]CQR22235.1 Uncharacterised protein [Yersinia enterocolitica]